MFPVTLKCPRCGTTFRSAVLGSFGYSGAYSDLCRRFWGLNPLPYFIHTCPNCSYTGGTSEFATVSGEGEEGLPTDLEFGCRKYGLLAERYASEGKSSYEVARMYHMGACCARLSGKRDLELLFLDKALKWLLRAVEEEAVPKREEAVAFYLLGELHRLAGDFDSALKYYEMVPRQGSAEEWLVKLALRQMEHARRRDRELKML